LKRTQFLIGAAILVLVGALISPLLLRYYRWHNYSNKPLFFNAYGPPDGFGPWCWDQDPSPLADGFGDLIFVDFSQNELAVVRPTSENPTWVVNGISPDHFHMATGQMDIILPKSPNSLILADPKGVHVIHRLRPDEAKSEFDALSALMEDRRAMKASIESFLSEGNQETN
jgi:hypothetical protein